MRRKNNVLAVSTIIAFAIFAVITLLALRIRINQLVDEKNILENEISSYKEKISELEEDMFMPDNEFWDEIEKGNEKGANWRNAGLYKL